MSLKRLHAHTEAEDDVPPAKKACADSESGGSKWQIRSAAFAARDKADPDKPAELFRKDLISAMKLPDTEQLLLNDYMLITDPWKGEWERGVQVPVNPEQSSEPHSRTLEKNDPCYVTYPGGFRMPKRLLRESKEEDEDEDEFKVHDLQKKAEEACQYDLDNLDVAWLKNYNAMRVEQGLGDLTMAEWLFEQVLAEMESQCHERMQDAMKTKEGLGIEYDENVACDVCKTTEGEEDNEMVFCDGCDICVHQACYGISKVPEGRYLCRTCALGIKPQCIFCPKTGGAMKSTEDGSKWAHVACVLWIPEVQFSSAERMEPLVNISDIPGSRWNLTCSVCHERQGACIQCAVKSCKTAFHVTCAFDRNFTMKTTLDEEHDDVVLKAYCGKHSRRRENSECSPRKVATPRKEPMTEAEKREARLHRMHRIQEEFYMLVNPAEIAAKMKLDPPSIVLVYRYWMLKRKAHFNKPLMPSRLEAEMPLQENDVLYARIRMFVHLRQDLDRARNLCYMLIRREKLRRQLCSMKEEVFDKEAALCEMQSACKSPSTSSSSSNKSTRLDDALSRAYVQRSSFYDDHAAIAQCNKDAAKRDDWPVVHISSAVAASSSSSASAAAGRETPVASSARRKTNAVTQEGDTTDSVKRKKATSGIKQAKSASNSSTMTAAASDSVSNVFTPVSSTVTVKEELPAKSSQEIDTPVVATSHAAKKTTTATPVTGGSSKSSQSKKEQMKKLSEYFKPSELVVSDEVKRYVTEKLCPQSKKQPLVNGHRRGFNGMKTESTMRDAVQQCLISDENKALLPPDLSTVLREVSTGAGSSAKQAKAVSGSNRHSLPKVKGRRPRSVGTPLVPASSAARVGSGASSKHAEPSASAVSPTRGLLNSLKRLSQSTLSAFCRIGKRTSESDNATAVASASDDSDAHEPTIDVVGDGDYSASTQLVHTTRTVGSSSIRGSPGKSPLTRIAGDDDVTVASPKKNIHRRLFSDSPPSGRPSPTRALRSNANSVDSPNNKLAEL